MSITIDHPVSKPSVRGDATWACEYTGEVECRRPIGVDIGEVAFTAQPHAATLVVGGCAHDFSER